MKTETNEFFTRQARLICESMADFTHRRLDLNTFIQRLDGLTNAIGTTKWKAAIFPIILQLEQVNAFSIDADVLLTADDQTTIGAALCQLELLVERLQQDPTQFTDV